MNSRKTAILLGILFLACALLPAAGATDPVWTERVTTGELSCVVISEDGSTVVAGGDQLIALSRDGKKLWTGWSGPLLAISRDGNFVVTSRDHTVRLISGSGSMLWDESLGVPVEDVAMTPDASVIATGGGSRVKIISGSGSGIRLNTSIHVNHLRLFPEGDRIVITSKDGVQTSNLTLFSQWMDENVTQELVEVSADGSSFVTVTNNRVRMYTRNGSLQWDSALPGGNALGFAYSRDGSTIVVGRDDNTMTVLDRSGTLLWTAQATHWITSVAVSDDGNTIAAGSMDRTLSVYDRAGTKLGSFTAKEPIRARSVAVSGDGSVIAAVDASTVYGFSRLQFTQPVTTGPTPVTPMHSAVTTPARISPAATTTEPATIPPATPQAPLPVSVPLLVIGLLLYCRSRKS